MIPHPSKQSVFWIGETQWNLYGDLREVLFDERGLRLEEWMRCGWAHLIKSGSGRSIHRVRLPELELYVKRFRASKPANFLHQIVRRGRAEKEFHLAHVLAELGVSTIKPIALGERRRHGALLESYLITEAIPGGLPLFDVIEQFHKDANRTAPAQLRFHIAEELAKLAAAIHSCGIEHRDLHERNVIVRPDGQGRFQFFLLDLHELRVHKRLPWSSARRELTRMGRYFTLRTTASDRLRFFRRYCAESGVPAAEVRRLAREVEAATIESRADFWRRRDVRPLSKNPRIVEYRRPGVQAWAMRTVSPEVVERLLARPAAPFEQSVVRWLKDGRGTRVAEVKLDGIASANNLIYKQYYFKGWHESFGALFRPNQASRAWHAGGALLMRELPTPQPLLVVHQTEFGLPVTSYLLTEKVPEPTTLPQYFNKHLPNATPSERRRIVRGVAAVAARMLRRLHDRRASHRDLKASNILVTHTDDLAAPKLWLVDLDSVQTWMRVPEARKLQNLTRFHVSFHNSRWITRADRLRFLRIYLARRFREKDRWKALWKSIRIETQKKIRRNLSRGRSIV